MDEPVRFSELQNKLREILPEDRFYHTLGVSYTAASLAMSHGADIYKAQLAGLLHDSAKYLKSSEMIGECEKYNIEITDVERMSPGLLHTKLGAYFAKEVYGVEDEEILSAILYHTTGRPDMSILEEIIYVADYIEPGRPNLPYIDEMRACAFTDLHKATLYELKSVMAKVDKYGGVLDKRTEETFEFYKKNVEV